MEAPIVLRLVWSDPQAIRLWELFAQSQFIVESDAVLTLDPQIDLKTEGRQNWQNTQATKVLRSLTAPSVPRNLDSVKLMSKKMAFRN